MGGGGGLCGLIVVDGLELNVVVITGCCAEKIL